MVPFLLFVSLILFASSVLFGLWWWSYREEIALSRQAVTTAEQTAQQQVAAIGDELGKCREAYAALRAKAESRIRGLTDANKETLAEVDKLRRGAADSLQAIQSLRGQLVRFQSAVDYEAEAARVLAEARTEAARIIAEAQLEAAALRRQAEAIVADARKAAEEQVRRGDSRLAEAQHQARSLKSEADQLLAAATEQAAKAIAKAEEQAKKIAGDAYDLKSQVTEMERRLKAIRNQIEGYGDEYIVPAHSLLDELAEDVGYREAGQNLKAAREHSRNLVRKGQAATCDYVEENRRKTAVDFVVDAFNGKVDSALSRTKHDNAGKLSQEIWDAFTVVNANGEAFRNARINTEYLNARLAELKWAAIAQELKRQQAEEQRQIREQIREEEKARREYQRAIKEAAKEEEAVQKAMARLSEQMAKATESQRAAYEQQLLELQNRLKEAEERGQRAMSMAQLTKSGHVYIISNVGSFGEHVYKIGLTRRLDPLDRVRELGDSSVPFSFDVHALIKSEDAPALEHRLHRHFLIHQVNKVNHRKEFFRVDLETIRSEVESLGLESQWTMAAEATQYRESLAIERRIAEDPVAREQWLMRQLELEMVEENEPADDEAVLVTGADDDE
jgi:hypothetical protein